MNSSHNKEGKLPLHIQKMFFIDIFYCNITESNRQPIVLVHGTKSEKLKTFEYSNDKVILF